MSLSADHWRQKGAFVFTRLQNASENLHPMRVGEQNRDAVTLLQQALIMTGYPIPAGATGNYGEQTAAAVRAVQADPRLNLSRDTGIAGKQVLEALDGKLRARAPGAAAIAPPSPEHHALLFFGGAGPRFPPGALMTWFDDNGERTSARAYAAIQGRFTMPYPYNSAVSDKRHNAAVNAGFGFLQAVWRQPSLRKLVIYGFSAGAFNAVRLCDRIANSGKQVDLLITVDPNIGDIDPDPPGRFPINRPGRHVVKHFNWYQRRGDTKGRSIVTADVNEERRPPLGPRSAHDQMPTYTLVDVQPKINDVLGQAAVVRPW